MAESESHALPAQEQLRKAGFLANWREAEWSALLTFAEYKELVPAEFLFRQGDVERSMYILAKGTLEFIDPPKPGIPPRRLGVLQPGGVIGEGAFLDGGARALTVRAVSASALIRIDPESFSAFSARHPVLATEFLMEVARLVSLKLRDTTAMVTQHAPERAVEIQASAEESGGERRVDINSVARAGNLGDKQGMEFFDRLNQQIKEGMRRRSQT